MPIFVTLCAAVQTKGTPIFFNTKQHILRSKAFLFEAKKFFRIATEMLHPHTQANRHLNYYTDHTNYTILQKFAHLTKPILLN